MSLGRTALNDEQLGL